MRGLEEGAAVRDNYQANSWRHDAAGRLGLADTKLTGIDARRRVNRDMPRQRKLSPSQQKYQRNGEYPLSNTHTVILHQVMSRYGCQNSFTTIGLNPVNF